MVRKFELVDEVYFYSLDGLHKGYIEKFNKNTINVLEDNEDEPDGIRLWRVEEYFLAKNPEEAKQRWEQYRFRLLEYKKMLNFKRKQNNFFKGLSVLVEPFNKKPYKGMVLNVGKATLIIVTEEGKFMRVDKSIANPINELIHFKKVVLFNEKS